MIGDRAVPHAHAPPLSHVRKGRGVEGGTVLISASDRKNYLNGNVISGIKLMVILVYQK